MTWWLILPAVLVLLVALVLVVGSAVPRDHVAARKARFAQPPAVLWAAITDLERLAGWRKDLKQVERLPDRDGRPAWRETGAFGVMTMTRLESVPEQRTVTEITDDKLPFGGRWTWEIRPVAGGCELNITEAGFIKPAAFRFMARFVFGYTSTMDQVLRALGKSFGEVTRPEPGTEAAQ